MYKKDTHTETACQANKESSPKSEMRQNLKFKFELIMQIIFIFVCHVYVHVCMCMYI